jgi:hypothetical protein
LKRCLNTTHNETPGHEPVFTCVGQHTHDDLIGRIESLESEIRSLRAANHFKAEDKHTHREYAEERHYH